MWRAGSGGYPYMLHVYGAVFWLNAASHLAARSSTTSSLYAWEGPNAELRLDTRCCEFEVYSPVSNERMEARRSQCFLGSLFGSGGLVR